MTDTGLLIIRLVVGLLLAGHSAQKLFGMFGGPGFKGTSGWLGSMGLRPAGMWTLLAGLSEFGGGVLVTLGLLTPLGAIGIAAAMVMGALLAHRQALWITEGGMEYNLVLIAVVVALAFTGPGQFSLDALLGLSVPLPFSIGVAILALLSVSIALGTRTVSVPAQASSD